MTERTSQCLSSDMPVHCVTPPPLQPTPQAAGVLVALCSTGRLVAFIAAYKAQFVVADGMYIQDAMCKIFYIQDTFST